MEKSIGTILGKVALTFLLVFAIVGGLMIVQAQNKIAPQNPLVETARNHQIRMPEKATTEIDQEILDMESDVSEAVNEEYEGAELTPEEGVSNNLNYGAINLSNIGSGNNSTNSGETDRNSPGEGEIGGGDNKTGDDVTTLPTTQNYFIVDIVDLQEPYSTDDPRCYYKITHLQPELEIEQIVFVNNDKPISHFGGVANRGWINLSSGENWLKVRVTYRFPDGETRTFERTTNPGMVKVYDPLDINFDDNNLKDAYEQPNIDFYINPNPKEAHVQVLVNGRMIDDDGEGNYSANLNEGENQFEIRGSARGWNDTTVTKTVVYSKTKIRVYSPELENIDYNNSGERYYSKVVTFSVVVEGIETGQALSRADVAISVRGKREFTGEVGINNEITLPIQYGQNEVIISARGINSNNTVTEFVHKSYQINVGEDGEIPQQVIDDTNININIIDGQITHDQIYQIRLSPDTKDKDGNVYNIKPEKIRITHTYAVKGKESTIEIYMSQRFDEVYQYEVHLREGANVIHVVVTTDDGHMLPNSYVINYVPAEVTPEPKGTMFVSVEAFTIGKPIIAQGYVDITSGERLSQVVEKFLKQHGYDVSLTGPSQYMQYLEYIIKDNMMADWHDGMLSDEAKKFIEESNGAVNWHGKYDIHSLGDFDFTNAAGWKATINGVPISGMSNETPKDGDECRLMFTLTGGSDIGL